MWPDKMICPSLNAQYSYIRSNEYYVLYSIYRFHNVGVLIKKENEILSFELHDEDRCIAYQRSTIEEKSSILEHCNSNGGSGWALVVLALDGITWVFVIFVCFNVNSIFSLILNRFTVFK